MPKESILVVDDDKEIADLVEIHLISDGYKVFKANSAKEGLEIFQHEDLQLLIIDIMMPGLNGMEAAGKLRENDKNTVIVFVTALE